MRFRDRLTLVLIVLLAGVQALTIAVAYSYARHAMIERGKRELAIANQLFTRNMDIIAERVTTGVEVLALDYGLRTAIAENDRLTALSVLNNHGRRINARRMMYIDLDAKVEADTAAPYAGVGPFPFETLIDDAWNDGVATALATIDGETNWTIIVPVKAPEVIGFVAAFIPVDAALLDELRRLSAAPVSVALVTGGAAAGWRVIAASGDGDAFAAVPANFDPYRADAAMVKRAHNEFLYSTAQLPTAQNSAPVFVVHEFRLSDVLASNWTLFGPLFIVLLGGLIAAASGAYILARGVSAPLEKLAAAARRIRSGEYDIDAGVESRAREVDQLARALIETAQAIRDREADLLESNRSLEVARDEARDADRAKSQFIANMSHELRTPLNAIIGFADSIRREQLGPLGATEYRQFADYIASGGRGLLDLHNAILDIARIEAKKYELQTERFDLRELARDIEGEMGDMAEAKKVRLTAEIGDAPLTVEGDYAALMKAARNLVHNAVKFTPEDGAVTIRLDSRDGDAMLIVKDNGVGMNEDDAARLVKPFQRGHVEYDAEYPGAGLGLAVAAGIVALHGGALEIVSAPLAGATVTIRLARAAPQSGRVAA